MVVWGCEWWGLGWSKSRLTQDLRPEESSVVPAGLVLLGTNTQDFPGFPVRSFRHICVCGFLHGKPHEAHSLHQPRQEIRVRPGLLSAVPSGLVPTHSEGGFVFNKAKIAPRTGHDYQPNILLRIPEDCLGSSSGCRPSGSGCAGRLSPKKAALGLFMNNRSAVSLPYLSTTRS